MSPTCVFPSLIGKTRQDDDDSSQQARQEKTEANTTIQIEESLVQTIAPKPQTHNSNLYTMIISRIGEVVLASQQDKKILRYL